MLLSLATAAGGACVPVQGCWLLPASSAEPPALGSITDVPQQQSLGDDSDAWLPGELRGKALPGDG